MPQETPAAELTRLRAYLASRFSASVHATSTVDVAIALLEHLWRIEEMQVVALRTRYLAEQADMYAVVDVRVGAVGCAGLSDPVA